MAAESVFLLTRQDESGLCKSLLGSPLSLLGPQCLRTALRLESVLEPSAHPLLTGSHELFEVPWGIAVAPGASWGINFLPGSPGVCLLEKVKRLKKNTNYNEQHKCCCGYGMARFSENMLLWLTFWRGTPPVC